MNWMVDAFSHPMKNWGLIGVLVRREIHSRYRGAILGVLWPLLTPLLMMLVYTFVFGAVLKARWQIGGSDSDMGTFAIIVFSGLLLHGLMAEILGRAPRLVLDNPNYVKKVIFPLEILPWVGLGAALFHMALALFVLLGANALWGTGWHWSQLAFPLVVLPFSLLLLGLSWFLAALGVYVRDVAQLVNPLVTMLMFLSPVFYPMEALPDWARGAISLNPLTLVLEQGRQVLLQGLWPNWVALALYFTVALLAYGLGYAFFQTCRRGFADVI
ncbi:MAG: ABC transporter permease [Gammaproteobacteria bacterium]|nr:ABC transporter permease [Gammaproteobacteria bacterium]